MERFLFQVKALLHSCSAEKEFQMGKLLCNLIHGFFSTVRSSHAQTASWHVNLDLSGFVSYHTSTRSCAYFLL